MKKLRNVIVIAGLMLASVTVHAQSCWDRLNEQIEDEGWTYLRDEFWGSRKYDTVWIERFDGRMYIRIRFKASDRIYIYGGKKTDKLKMIGFVAAYKAMDDIGRKHLLTNVIEQRSVINNCSLHLN